MSASETLPGYAPMLSDYHRAYASELRSMVASLPIRAGDRVLELACGDGIYSRWLAERVGPHGSVTALDNSPAFLDLARNNTVGHLVELVNASVQSLPFPDGAFDLVWCAQSLYSLPDPAETLRAMRRVTRPGGIVAVLENDTLHHILLPWPIEVELAVRAAELQALADESDSPRKYYIGRELCELFHEAGLKDCRKQTFATNRQAPLSVDERAFLAAYLSDLSGRVLPYLDRSISEAFTQLVEPTSDIYILDRPDLTVTSLDHVVVGTRPQGPL